MKDARSNGEDAGTGTGLFAKTQWSVVLATGHEDSLEAMAALEQLCQTYRHPLYVYISSCGFAHHDAEDLTQGFFATLLQRQAFKRVVPGRARFRTFLLTALKNYLRDQRDRQHAQKRGGGQPLISLDAQEAEGGCRLEPTDTDTPEKLFERSWAKTQIDGAMSRLQQEYARDGRGALFDHLRGFIVEGINDQHYREVADRLGMSEEAVKKTVQRLRRGFREAVREEIAQTVTTKSEIDEELRYLVSALSS